MSHSQDIDNDEHLFQFDSYQDSTTSAASPSLMFARNFVSADLGGSGTSVYTGGSQGATSKGKAPAGVSIDFSYTPSPSDSFNEESADMDVDPSPDDPYLDHSFSPMSPSMFNPDTFVDSETGRLSGSIRMGGCHESNAWPVGSANSPKGKEREHPPVLPPLSFSPTSFDSEHTFWEPSSVTSPGPSSYGSSLYSPPPASVFDSHARSSQGESIAGKSTDQVPIPLTSETTSRLVRTRSLSTLSARSTPSSTSQSVSRIRSRLLSARPQNKLTRKLFSRKSGPTITPSRPNYTRSITFGSIEAHSHLLNHSFTTKLKVDELDSTLPDFQQTQAQYSNSTSSDAFYTVRPVASKHKWRSNSSPYPISALDFIPVTSPTAFEPIPIVVNTHFDGDLPKEIRLHILSSLVQLHENDHAKVIESGRWSAGRASSSRGKWVGRAKGYRELVKFSRVNKTWRELVFDGQLWTGIDLQQFQLVPETFLLRLARAAGTFIQQLEIANYMRIPSNGITAISDALCSPAGMDGLGYTRLTSINLQGCSQITTRSLHYLLVRSPLLTRLSVRGMDAVTNTTCDILSAYCPCLMSLNMSRCPNMDAEGIRRMASAAISRREDLPLKHLRLSGLKRVSESMMYTLGKAAPHLEVLDLSYARDLHNAALEAFVACELDGPVVFYDSETVVVLAKDLGREPIRVHKYRRRVTRLRHLSLSACDLLTDEACSNLAHSVPRLEFLELAGIGADLKPEGLVRLLNTTPHIRRLDLEDATEITDAVLATLTPSEPTRSANGSKLRIQPAEVDPETGYALEHLVVSYATRLTDEAFYALIRRCNRLNHIESDNTRIGAGVLKEFVRLCRKRKQVNVVAGVVDCRGISEPTVKELSLNTRPRLGWRSYNAKRLGYLDGRDGNLQDLKLGQDECDETRVVLKSFYSWQTVDAVKNAREKRRNKSRRNVSDASGGSGDDTDDTGARGGGVRWWSPGVGATRSGRGSPSRHLADLTSNDGCVVM